jgi:hypothetical protein
VLTAWIITHPRLPRHAKRLIQVEFEAAGASAIGLFLGSELGSGASVLRIS